MPRSIPITELKLVFLKSGGRCAMPGCNRFLVEEGGADDQDVVLGVVAHIVAYSTNGPRGDPTLAEADRNKEPNLVLLCPTCHEIVDGQDSRYNVAELRRIKAEHQSRIMGSVTTASLQRADRLADLARESRARCVVRWLALGVDEAEASVLADDETVGALSTVLSEPPPPVTLLLGELGIGKSLVGERVFQAAVAKALEDVAAPIPIYLRADEVAGNLRNAVETASQQLGDLRSLGATVVVDGADEAGSGVAARLLNEARVLVRTWTKTTVLVSSRPLPALSDAREAVEMTPLTPSDAARLIAHVAGENAPAFDLDAWPEAVRDAATRPLFAILAGIFIRDQDQWSPRSAGELVAHLVRRSLQKTGTDATTAHEALRRLALLAVDRRGGSIPPHEVVSGPQLQALLESRLVVERPGGLRFALPILAEWFAAESLAVGEPDADSLLGDAERLERWRYPLITAASVFGYREVTRLLAPIAEQQPALGAQIALEGLSGRGLGAETLLPPARECGQQIQTAMRAWLRGLGPLAPLIAPVKDSSVLRPLGIRTEHGLMRAGWYTGDEDLGEVVELPAEVDFMRLSRAWPEMYSVGVGGQPAWAWRWTIERLRDPLKRWLDERRLDVESGPLAREAAWRAALVLMGYGSFYHESIPMAELTARLQQLPADALIARPLSQPMPTHALGRELTALAASGATHLDPPWPGPDSEPQSSWAWSNYSDQQILRRAQAVYEGALEGYQQLVQTWFPKFASRLQMAATMPAVLTGKVVPPRHDEGFGGGPGIHWYLEPLPYGSSSASSFSLVQQWPEIDFEEFERLTELVRSTRPSKQPWIYGSMGGGALDIFRDSPMTDLAYQWLWDDLQRVGWVEGILRRRG